MPSSLVSWFSTDEIYFMSTGKKVTYLAICLEIQEKENCQFFCVGAEWKINCTTGH